MISLTDQIITTNINLSPWTLVEFPELLFFFAVGLGYLWQWWYCDYILDVIVEIFEIFFSFADLHARKYTLVALAARDW
jgi:hypothetical protein